MFKNTTQYDEELILAMNRIAHRTFRRGVYTTYQVFFVLAGLFLLVPSALFFAFGLDGAGASTVVSYGFALVVGLAALLFGLFVDRIFAHKSKRMMGKGSIQRELTFGEENITVEAPGLGRSEFYYATICGIFETNRYFFLQSDKHHGLMLDKFGFTHGTEEEFKKFITEKTGKDIKFVKIKH